MSKTLQIDSNGSARAYLMINCETGTEMQILDMLRSYPQIREAELTLGRHDILVQIEADSFEELRETILLKIRKIPEIRSTTTLMCIDRRA